MTKLIREEDVEVLISKPGVPNVHAQRLGAGCAWAVILLAGVVIAYVAARLLGVWAFALLAVPLALYGLGWVAEKAEVG